MIVDKLVRTGAATIARMRRPMRTTTS